MIFRDFSAFLSQSWKFFKDYCGFFEMFDDFSGILSQS